MLWRQNSPAPTVPSDLACAVGFVEPIELLGPAFAVLLAAVVVPQNRAEPEVELAVVRRAVQLASPLRLSVALHILYSAVLAHSSRIHQCHLALLPSGLEVLFVVRFLALDVVVDAGQIHLRTADLEVLEEAWGL